MNIVASIALQENAIAHIINAESEKIEAIIKIQSSSFEAIMDANTSIKNTLEALLQLEFLLQRKLALITSYNLFYRKQENTCFCCLKEMDRYDCEQQAQELYTSIAYVESALAAITNIEGAKIQKLVGMQEETVAELLCLNASVEDVLEIITMFEIVLKRKAAIIKNYFECCK